MATLFSTDVEIATLTPTFDTASGSGGNTIAVSSSTGNPSKSMRLTYAGTSGIATANKALAQAFSPNPVSVVWDWVARIAMPFPGGTSTFIPIMRLIGASNLFTVLVGKNAAGNDIFRLQANYIPANYDSTFRPQAETWYRLHFYAGGSAGAERAVLAVNGHPIINATGIGTIADLVSFRFGGQSGYGVPAAGHVQDFDNMLLQTIEPHVTHRHAQVCACCCGARVARV